MKKQALSSRAPKARGTCFSLVKSPHLKATEIDFVAVVLQDDMPGTLLSESGDRLVLAGSEQGIHARGAELEFDDFLAVEPVLAVVAADHDARAVPLAHGMQLFPVIGRDQVVQ